LGLRAVVVVPAHAPTNKIARIRSLGAHVEVRGDSFEQSLGWAHCEARRRDWCLLHAFDDPDVIAGQGTIALELVDLQPDLVLVPIGGGGLASGVSLMMRSFGIPVVGVQVEGVDAMAQWLRGGRPRIDARPTVADGLRVNEPGHLTRTLCRDGLDDIVLVTEEEVKQTMVSLVTNEGLWIEGAGAVAVAGMRHVTSRRPVAVVTGGNVDLSVIQGLMDNARNGRSDAFENRRCTQTTGGADAQQSGFRISPAERVRHRIDHA